MPGSGRVRLAFAGDVHFQGSSAKALGGDIGSAGRILRRADLAVVNLETAITTRGRAEPKQYTFRAPASGLRALRRSGVDVVTVANNHGMDYGRIGLDDTLKAGKRSGVPMIGAGRNIDEAFTPYRRTIHGVRLAVFGATDVLDSFAVNSWKATGETSGLASSKDPERLLKAVREAARTDVVVVVLHWGVERQSCPTARQRELADLLTDAGASVVVGSHAHVLEPAVHRGRTAVHYGLGNFVFYANGGPGARTGVYGVVVDRRGVVGTSWHPARIHGGRPQLLSGRVADTARREQKDLTVRCGVD
ncbi:hypothetical protein Kisp02_66200 [Kineosporia sp. NBRC 101731]|nr:hypothetical protein Kisp02_66200 [Kineosporia sp. NBRC 101731]